MTSMNFEVRWEMDVGGSNVQKGTTIIRESWSVIDALNGFFKNPENKMKRMTGVIRIQDTIEKKGKIV